LGLRSFSCRAAFLLRSFSFSAAALLRQ
jgi:hypothetical protein